MRLLETEIDETSVELTYADSDRPDDAERLLIVRMPSAGPETKSLAWHRLQTLLQLSAVLETEISNLTALVRAN